MVNFQFSRDDNLEGIWIDTWQNPLTVPTGFARQPLYVIILSWPHNPKLMTLAHLHSAAPSYSPLQIVITTTSYFLPLKIKMQVRMSKVQKVTHRIGYWWTANHSGSAADHVAPQQRRQPCRNCISLWMVRMSFYYLIILSSNTIFFFLKTSYFLLPN